MALIKCPECGKEISNKATNCIHCGYPIDSKQQNQTKKRNENVNTITIKNQKHILLVATVFVLVLGIVFGTKIIKDPRENRQEEQKEEQAYQAMINESRENISPYLEYIGEYMRNDEKLSLPSNLYQKQDNLQFMGMKGQIEFGIVKNTTKSKYVKYCSWTSSDGFSEEEFQEVAKKLDAYFGCEAKEESRDYSKGHTYRYYWIDNNSGLYATCGHGLFSYLPNGGVEIIWANEYCEGLDFYELNI